MNKLGTKMSKLDRFLVTPDVIDFIPNLAVIVLERRWSGHNPILCIN